MVRSQSLNPNKLILQIFILFAATILVGIISLSLGSVSTNMFEVINTLFGNPSNEQLSQIIFQIRLPRIIYAIFILILFAMGYILKLDLKTNEIQLNPNNVDYLYKPD